MAKFVEGDWKTFRFRMIQPSDHARVLAHLRDNFYRDEPLCRHTGYEDDMADDFDMLVSEAFADNLSFLAEDKETGKIAGVRVITIVHPNKRAELPPFKSPNTGPIVKVLVSLTEQANLFQRYPKMDKYIDFFLVSVDREYRGHGLATEIYDRAFKLLTGLHFSLIKCVFSSPYTQKIARKRGFTEICQSRFLDLVDEKGITFFPNANEDERAILMVKEL